MMGDTEYNSAAMAMGFYGSLLQAVAKEYGWEKALAMHGNLGYPMGVSSAQEIKKAAGSKKPDIKLVEEANTQFTRAFGVEFKVSQKGNNVRYDVSRCPLYDSLKSSGFSHDQVRKLCEAMSQKEYEGINSVLPNISGRLAFRNKADENCIEEFMVT